MRADVAAVLLARVARSQARGRLPSLAAGVVQDGELSWSAGRGSIDGTPEGARPGADTHYRIGSITKTFVAVLVMRLRDEGRLRLDDPVERHLPGTVLGARTIGQLLGHTSGLTSESPGRWWERAAGGSWDQLADSLAPEHLVLDAGVRFHYSNTGFGVLGEVVARLRAAPWYDCVAEEILEPLAMRRTAVVPRAPAALGLAVHPWADLVLPEPAPDAGAMAPAGQLWSTVADLARFARIFLGQAPEVLAPATAAEMGGSAALDPRPAGSSGYGLGLQVHAVASDGSEEASTLVGHGGSMPGFLASLLVEPAEQTASIVLANATAGLEAAVGADLLGVLRRLEPRVRPEWQPTTRAEMPDLDALGPWYWGPTPLALLLRGSDELELVALRGIGRTASFTRRGEDWVGRNGYYAGETLRIVRGPTGDVSHLDLATFVFTRTPYGSAEVQPGGVDPLGWT